MQRNIKVLVVEPNKLPYEKVISNRLRDKQQIVDGYIEYVRLLDDDSVVLICNEEGKINGSEYNRDIGYDIIAGTFIIARECADDGEDRSLTDEQIEKYKERFNQESIEKTNQKILSIVMHNNAVEM
ncbi:MAG: DUF3846 domain-containing protein [Bacilli bacterium]|nr:DUF3846 domain-containing protein [Bacilli bacterium]